MQKLLFVIISVFAAFTLQAQVQNPSFEQTDSLGNIAKWQLLSGNITQLTSAQFGVIPFTAFAGNFFALIESDTQTTTTHTGKLEQIFPLADTPGSFSFQYFYIPESIARQAQVELYLSKWNGNTRDTILYIHKPIVAVADSNQLKIQWNAHSTPLKNEYRSAILPDSATIRFLNDNGTVAGKNIRLYLDAIRFEKWAVGFSELQAPLFTIYPNPASETLIIGGGDEHTDCSLLSIDGKHHLLPKYFSRKGLELDVRLIPDGLYLLSIQKNGTTITKRILINHEQ
jgi:hypothetical protein